MATQSSAGSVTILRCIGRGKSATKTWRLLAGAELPEKTDFDAGAGLGRNVGIFQISLSSQTCLPYWSETPVRS